MDEIASILTEIATLALEISVSGWLYKLYSKYDESLKQLKEAQHLELNEGLKRDVQKNNGVIKYAAISGTVKALSLPLSSRCVPHLKGVIRDTKCIEHKIRWIPFWGTWGSSYCKHLYGSDYVPFALCSKTTDYYQKICVEVIEPLKAEELVIPLIYNNDSGMAFHQSRNTIRDTLSDVIRREKTLSLEGSERLLCENKILTAVGKLVIENKEIKIKPPDEGLTYFLTPLSLESLMNKMNISKNFYRVAFIIMGALSFFYFLYIVTRVSEKVKQGVINYRKIKKLEEEIKLMRMDDIPQGTTNGTPKCIVCVENPVQIILNCGHACLCTECSPSIRCFCPMCRSRITRKSPVYWP